MKICFKNTTPIPPPAPPLPNHVNQPQSKLKKLAMKVLNVIKIIFAVALTVFFFWTNPSIFAVCFLVGISFSKRVQKTINKIRFVVSKQVWPFLILGGAASVLSLPVFFATSSCLWAAYLGSQLYLQAKATLPPKKKPLILRG